MVVVSEGSTGSHRCAGGCCSISCAGDALQSFPCISGDDRGALGAPVHVSSTRPEQRPGWSPTLRQSQTCVACDAAALASGEGMVRKGFWQVAGL